MRSMKPFEMAQFALTAPFKARAMANAQRLAPEEIKELQRQRFVKMVRYAYENVPFYTKKYDDAGVIVHKINSVSQISELPPVEKSELIENYPDRVISRKYKDHKKLFVLVTGGTSGQTIKIAQQPEAMFDTILSYHRAYSHMMDGYKSSHSHAYVYTGPYPIDGFVFGAYPLHFVWTLDPTEVAFEKLKKAQPHLMTMYPSTLERLSQELTPDQIKEVSSRLKVISVNSEMSSQAQRDAWEKVWGVKVLDEYSSEEISTIMAYQCQHKKYHIQEDLAILEAVDANNQPVLHGVQGDLLATSLNNWAMPFIRYRQQDCVTLEHSSEKCGCGVNFAQLRSFEGRRNQSFTLKSGRKLNSGYLLDVGYSALVNYADAINYWSLIQETKENVVLECVPGKQMTPEVAGQIEKEISSLLFGEASVKVRLVEEPTRTAVGKRHQIISKVPG